MNHCTWVLLILTRSNRMFDRQVSRDEDKTPINGLGLRTISAVVSANCNSTGSVNCSVWLMVKMILPVYGEVLAGRLVMLIPTPRVPVAPMFRLPAMVVSLMASQLRLLSAMAMAVQCKVMEGFLLVRVMNCSDGLLCPTTA